MTDKRILKIGRELLNEYYNESEVCMGEFLAWKKVPHDMTYEEAFRMYMNMMNVVEGDHFYQVADGQEIALK